MYSFCYVGRLSKRQKRVDLLLDFCLQLSNSGIPFVLNIFGSGDACIIDRLRTIPGVNVLGFRDNWLDCIETNHVFLLFSDYEGCPLSLLEFHKYIGNRVLARRANGVKQYLSANCLFDTVADAVNLLINDADLYNRTQLTEYFSEVASRKQVDVIFDQVFTQ